MEFSQAIQSRIIICDGAMGTELQRRGLGRGEAPDLWNITHPDKVREVHEEYIKAGARAILTNTFGSNSMRLGKGSQYSVQQLIRAAVEAAKSCAGKDVFVFGDIGPTGLEDQLPPYGSCPEHIFYDAFKEQAIALAEAGVDAMLIETMSNLAEAEIAVRAASENTPMPVICSMSFARPPKSRPDDLRTSWGDSISDIVSKLTQAGAKGLGSNCGELVEDMPNLAREMRKLTDLPLIFEVNAGRPTVDVELWKSSIKFDQTFPKFEGYRTIYKFEPEKLADITYQLVQAGANIVGGCCGTNPEHIRAIRDRLAKEFPDRLV